MSFLHQGPRVTERSLVTGAIYAVCNCLVSVPSCDVAVTVTGLGPSVAWPNRIKITCPLAFVWQTRRLAAPLIVPAGQLDAGGAGKVPSTTTCALGNSIPLALPTVTRILP